MTKKILGYEQTGYWYAFTEQGFGKVIGDHVSYVANSPNEPNLTGLIKLHITVGVILQSLLRSRFLHLGYPVRPHWRPEKIPAGRLNMYSRSLGHRRR
jgi:hypothetical protein